MIKNKNIAVIAPSNTMSIVSNVLKEIGRKNVNRLGYDVKYGINANKEKFHTAGTLEERLMDLNSAINDPSVEIIMPVFGGYNSNQLLPYLDYDSISISKKKFIGFSDTTALLLSIARYTTCEVYHGPSFSVLCDPALPNYTFSALKSAMRYETTCFYSSEVTACDEWWLKKNYGPRKWDLFDGWKVYKEGEVEAPIIGGNLDTICTLAGTKFFPLTKNCIFFIEVADCSYPGIFHRNLTQLKQIGVFDSICAFIIGLFPYGTTIINEHQLIYILNDILGDRIHFPVLYDVNCSHVDPMITIPIGKMAKICAKKQPSLTINV